MLLHQIPKIASIDKQTFLKDYFRPQKPVIIQNAIKEWPASNKWSLDYFKSIGGDMMVPLYDDRPVTHKNKFNQPHDEMKMSAYIDLLKKEPTKYRIFLWNILKEIPELQQDFLYPKLGIPLLKSLPMLFFGGEDSYTFMHYDIDLANIFHIHFEGKKKVILFDQNQNDYLYKVPYSLITREDIDFKNPDFNKWPALKNAVGYNGELEHGDMLYMPEGYWHYMQYITPGFSMSLRGVPQKPMNFGKAVSNVFVLRHFDNIMRRLKGQDWIDWKNEQAILRTHKKLKIKHEA